MQDTQGWVDHARRVAVIYERHGMPTRAAEWQAAADVVEEEICEPAGR